MILHRLTLSSLMTMCVSKALKYSVKDYIKLSFHLKPPFHQQPILVEINIIERSQASYCTLDFVL